MTPAVSRLPNGVDPYALLEAELACVRSSIFGVINSSQSTLADVASYYFHLPSKQMRPLVVLLFSRVANGLGAHSVVKHWSAQNLPSSGDQLVSSPEMLEDLGPSMPEHAASFNSPFDLRPPTATSSRPSPPPSIMSAAPSLQLTHTILPTQVRLAQIVEMIHVASLLHDDVIDDSNLRRGLPSGPVTFGNKLSILGGDFLLGRANFLLSRLGEHEVVELIGSAVDSAAQGEVLQIEEGRVATKADSDARFSLRSTPFADVELPDRWNTYLRKTYFKTASIIAKGARAAVVLGGCGEGEIWKEIAYAYGRNLGIAFQLVDDALDFSPSSAPGKPCSGMDLRQGLITGPVLYAASEYPELEPLIARGFKHEGDVERALALVYASSGISRTRDLAQVYAEKAKEVLKGLPPSKAKEALETLADMVVMRET